MAGKDQLGFVACGGWCWQRRAGRPVTRTLLWSAVLLLPVGTLCIIAAAWFCSASPPAAAGTVAVGDILGPLLALVLAADVLLWVAAGVARCVERPNAVVFAENPDKDPRCLY